MNCLNVFDHFVRSSLIKGLGFPNQYKYLPGRCTCYFLPYPSILFDAKFPFVLTTFQ